MIIKKIEITAYRTVTENFEETADRFVKRFGAWTTDYNEVKDAEDYDSKKFTFLKWTKAGKLSKMDGVAQSVWGDQMTPIAEKAYADLLVLESQTENDMARALELAQTINSANFNTEDLKTISTKISQSKWYDNDGSENMRSIYTKKVPASVFDEAMELQAIRKKHQGNFNFDFYATSYKTIETREADHQNFGQNWNV